MFLDLDELNLLREAPEDEIDNEENIDELDTEEGDSTEEVKEETPKDDKSADNTSNTDEENDTSIGNGDEFEGQELTSEPSSDSAEEDPENVDSTEETGNDLTLGFNIDEIKLAELYDKFIATKNVLEQLNDTLMELNYYKNSKIFDRIQANLDKLIATNKRILMSEFTIEGYESYLSSYYFIHGNLQTINDIFTVISDSEKSSDDK